jgi:ABC-type branched-subunit amino acid transport system substrate-binding protein
LPTLNEAKIANFTQSGSALLTPENGPYQFAVIGSAAYSGAQLADYAAEVGAKRVALIRDDSAASLSGGREIEARLKAHGVALIGMQQYKFHPTDVTPQLLSLRATNPEYLILYSASQDDVGTVQRNIGEIGWNVKEIGSLPPVWRPISLFRRLALTPTRIRSLRSFALLPTARKRATWDRRT